MGIPESRYCATPKGHVGYQVFGDGPPNIVFVPNWITNVEVIWEEPSARRYLERLGSMGRVVFADKRGTGISDPHGTGRALPVEEYVDDIINVMDGEGIEEAVLIGDTEGSALALVLAALHPKRFPEMVIINGFARLKRAEDYPLGAPQHVMDSLYVGWQQQYGRSAEALQLTAPSVADDQRFKASWLRQLRLSAPPGVAGEAIAWIGDTDVRSVLPAIQSRTMVLARRDAIVHRATFGRDLADNIDKAEYLEVEGADTFPFYAGDFSPILDEVEEFITGERNVVDASRMLATVLFTDIVGSTAIASRLGDDRWLDLRSAHDETVSRTVDRHRGRLVKTTGDGVLATFDGPLRAILAALSMKQELGDIGLNIRAGLHTGEVEVRDDELGGLAVNIASRVMDTAESGGILASGTVKDLVVGSALEFDACGQFELKGVPGDWRIYEVRDPLSA